MQSKKRCPFCDEKMTEEDGELFCMICGYSEPIVPKTLSINTSEKVGTIDKAGK